MVKECQCTLLIRKYNHLLTVLSLIFILGCLAYYSGLYIEHNEFGGRAQYGFDSVSNPPLYRDGNGHGTHVASKSVISTD